MNHSVYLSSVINLGLLNTYWPLILPCIANSSTIFFILQYLQSSMSEELLDSARIDGAGEVKIFHSFILPLSKPALSTMVIFNFVSYWNNFFNPMILLFDDKKFTVPLLINNLNSGMLQDLGAKYSAICHFDRSDYFGLLSDFQTSDKRNDGWRDQELRKEESYGISENFVWGVASSSYQVEGAWNRGWKRTLGLGILMVV
mgnify:CR=1 FL=1